jgi:putative glutamine amidotransferase
MPRTPVVLICGTRVEQFNGTPAHVVRDTYVRALVELAGVMPVFAPVIGNALEFETLLERVDGLLLTGASSHLSPACYGAEREFDDEHLEPYRDATSMGLIRAALQIDMPIFAICRGFQELNVICGGTLHQNLCKIPGTINHRYNNELTHFENYHARAHKLTTQKGGLFEQWNMPPEFHVNTLHTQGINKLGKGLHVEAVCTDDNVIEAFSMPGKKFVIAAQWHPEGDGFMNEPSARLFEEFGKVVQS